MGKMSCYFKTLRIVLVSLLLCVVKNGVVSSTTTDTANDNVDYIDDLMGAPAQPRGVIVDPPENYNLPLPQILPVPQKFSSKFVAKPLKLEDFTVQPTIDKKDMESIDYDEGPYTHIHGQPSNVEKIESKTLQNPAAFSYNDYEDIARDYDNDGGISTTRKPYRKYHRTEEIDYYVDHNSPDENKRGEVHVKKEKNYPEAYLNEEEINTDTENRDIDNNRYDKISENAKGNFTSLDDIANFTRNIQEKLKPFIKDNVGTIQKIPRKNLDSAASGSAPVYLAHKKAPPPKKPAPKSTKHEQGGGKEQESEHHEEGGKESDKKHDGEHKEAKAEKGHHEKQDKKDSFEAKKGEKAEHHHDDGEHENYEHEEKGEKGDKYDEHEKYKDGHETKGEHNIHKKDEYEKKVEFYDEFYDSGEYDKHGKYTHDDDYAKGGHKKGGHKKEGDHHDHYDKEEISDKNHHYSDKKGYDNKKGGDEHHDHYRKFSKKGHNSKGKKWAYKHP